MNQNELYSESMQEYISQLKLHISDLEHSIEINKEIIESEQRQIELETLRMKLVIDDFNGWAVENGCKKL